MECSASSLCLLLIICKYCIVIYNFCTCRFFLKSILNITDCHCVMMILENSHFNTFSLFFLSLSLFQDQGKMSVLRKQEDKEKKRQLIQANKARKRAESTHRANQRRLSQQTRRQREKALVKQAKERVERLNRQKEADVSQRREEWMKRRKRDREEREGQRKMEEVREKEEGEDVHVQYQETVN